MSDHPELENSVAAFVLGAAEEEEMDEVRAHLGGCAECRELVTRLQRAADALPMAADMVQPPAQLKLRILKSAAASPRTAAHHPARSRMVLFPQAPTLRRSWRPHLSAIFPTAAIAALALAVLALGAWNLRLVDQLNHQPSFSAVAATTLSGQGELVGAQATLLDFNNQSVALVTFSRLPAPPPGKVYEVWLTSATGAAANVAVFQPDADGSKTVVLNRDVRKYKLISVTVEDGPSGAPAPTQAPVLAGKIV